MASMAKSRVVAMRLETPAAAKLARLAKADHRTISSLAAKIILEWLKQSKEAA